MVYYCIAFVIALLVLRIGYIQKELNDVTDNFKDIIEFMERQDELNQQALECMKAQDELIKDVVLHCETFLQK